jgi:hypothetical protein
MPAQRALCLSFALLAGACTTLGTVEVRVETGNQPSGYLSRPTALTISSDESVREVAQRICDNVKAGSIAQVAFVGKEPSPEPISIADWNRYRYDCVAAAAPAKSAVARTSPAPAAGPASVPAATAVAATSLAAPPAPAVGAASAAAPDPEPVPALKAGRECLLQAGNYHLCMANCMLNATGSSETVPGLCEAQCAPKVTPDCRN